MATKHRCVCRVLFRAGHIQGQHDSYWSRPYTRRVLGGKRGAIGRREDTQGTSEPVETKGALCDASKRDAIYGCGEFHVACLFAYSSG